MDKSPGGNLGVVVGLVEKIKGLKEVLAENIPYAFPAGMAVHWKHGHHTRSGVVDMHSNWRGSDVRVELSTGSTRWIDVTQLLEFTDHNDLEQ